MFKKKVDMKLINDNGDFDVADMFLCCRCWRSEEPLVGRTLAGKSFDTFISPDKYG